MFVARGAWGTTEIGIIAAYLAYFDIAAQRVADVIPIFIEADYLGEICTQLTRTLSKKLGLTGPGAEERCRGLTVEVATVRKQRESLEQRKKMRRGFGDMEGHSQCVSWKR